MGLMGLFQRIAGRLPGGACTCEKPEHEQPGCYIRLELEYVEAALAVAADAKKPEDGLSYGWSSLPGSDPYDICRKLAAGEDPAPLVALLRANKKAEMDARAAAIEAKRPQTERYNRYMAARAAFEASRKARGLTPQPPATPFERGVHPAAAIDPAAACLTCGRYDCRGCE